MSLCQNSKYSCRRKEAQKRTKREGKVLSMFFFQHEVQAGPASNNFDRSSWEVSTRTLVVLPAVVLENLFQVAVISPPSLPVSSTTELQL